MVVKAAGTEVWRKDGVTRRIVRMIVVIVLLLVGMTKTAVAMEVWRWWLWL